MRMQRHAVGGRLAAGVLIAAAARALGAQSAPASATRQISITLRAPVDVALAAFGPAQESKWAPGWKPHYLSSSGPADDPDAAVFTTGTDERPTTWVMTAHDRAQHTIQYVSVLPGAVLTVIDIACVSKGARQTSATITYRRTALRPESTALVEDFANHFASQADHWQEALNRYLERANP